MASLIWTRLPVSHGRTKRTGYKPPVLSVRFVRAYQMAPICPICPICPVPRYWGGW
jgi:hypothetical protein